MKQQFVIHPLDALSRRSPAAKADVAARSRGHAHRSAATAPSEPARPAAAPARRAEPADRPGLQHPGRPIAWARYDGARVLTANEKLAHVTDGRGFQVEDFDIPLFAHPALTDADRAALRALLQSDGRTPGETAALRRILGED